MFGFFCRGFQIFIMFRPLAVFYLGYTQTTAAHAGNGLSVGRRGHPLYNPDGASGVTAPDLRRQNGHRRPTPLRRLCHLPPRCMDQITKKYGWACARPTADTRVRPEIMSCPSPRYASSVSRLLDIETHATINNS